MPFIKHLMQLSISGLPVIMLAVLCGCSNSPLKTQTQTNDTDKLLLPEQPKSVNKATQAEYAQAMMAIRNGNNSNAEAKLLLLTQKYPGLSGPYTNLGIIYFKSGNLDKAREYFNRAIALNSQNAIAHNYLGIIYRNNGEFQEALQAYQAALKGDPDYAYAHLNIGILYDLYLIKPRRALEHYQRYQMLASTDDKKVDIWIKDLKRRNKSK